MKILVSMFPVAVTSVLLLGCTGTVKPSNLYASTEQYPQKESSAWCAEHYSSASVGANQWQGRAKHCDPEARQAYLEGQRQRRERLAP